jgi:hypothetical protein
LSAESLTSRIDAINQELRHKVLEKVMVRRTRSNIQHEPRYAGPIHYICNCLYDNRRKISVT